MQAAAMLHPLKKGKKPLEKEEATALEKGQFLEKGNVAKKVAVLESKTATNKQAKSLAKGKETAALEKGSEKKQSPEAQSEPLAVLVDWHHCLKNGPQDTVLVQDLMALQKLLDKGVEVHVLSFCGAKQVPKVEKEIWDKLPDLIDQLHWWGTCTSRTGVGGKAEYATEWGCRWPLMIQRTSCKSWAHGVSKPMASRHPERAMHGCQKTPGLHPLQMQ